jgi:hypothetical protein
MTARRMAPALIAAAALAAAAAPAGASTTFYPSKSNGVKIYLSQACHDRGTGSCQPNYGCNGYNENVGSARIARSSLYDQSNGGQGFLSRGYTVRIGDGLTSQNINDSNNFRPKLHIPIHSNASGSCPNSAAGTWGLYKTTNSKQINEQLVYTVGGSSPGTNDKIVYRTDLGELNSTTAVAGYLEAGFHTNTTETNWLNSYNTWSWRLPYAVERCLGYPRNGAPTSTKYCSF